MINNGAVFQIVNYLTFGWQRYPRPLYVALNCSQWVRGLYHFDRIRRVNKAGVLPARPMRFAGVGLQRMTTYGATGILQPASLFGAELSKEGFLRIKVSF